MKESNWALVQYRTRPFDAGTRSPSSGSAADGRTDETWFLIEEIVPAEYRAALLEAGLQQQKPKSSRRISFLRSVRKKSSKAPPLPTISSPVGSADILAGSKGSKISLPYTPSRNGSGAVVVHGSRSTSPALKQPDDSIFAPGSGGPPTKVVSLTKSFSSAGMSHSSTAHTIPEEQTSEPIDTPPVVIHREDISNGIGGTLSSQRPAGTSSPAGVGHSSQTGGIGYTKPAAKSGNAFMDMMRKTTRRKDSSTLNPTTFGTPQATNRSAVRTPIDSPTELHTPASAASAGFNLQEHGVAGSGQPMASPTVSALACLDSSGHHLHMLISMLRFGWKRWTSKDRLNCTHSAMCAPHPPRALLRRGRWTRRLPLAIATLATLRESEIAQPLLLRLRQQGIEGCSRLTIRFRRERLVPQLLVRRKRPSRLPRLSMTASSRRHPALDRRRRTRPDA